MITPNKKFIIDVINKSNTFQTKVTNLERKKIINTITNLSDKNISKLFIILNLKEENIIYEDINIKKLARDIDKKVNYLSIVPLPGSLLLLTAYKIATFYNYKCVMRCRKDKSNKKLCYKQCEVESLEKAIEECRSNLKDCWYEKNPNKCKKDINKYIRVLEKRLQKVQSKLKIYSYEIGLEN